MGKEKKAVLVYHDVYEHLKDLSFEDKGKIFDAILEYDMTGNVSIELSPVLNMAFKFIKSAIDRDKEAYNKKCIKNSQNGSKGGRPNAEKANGLKNTSDNPSEENKPKKANGFFENPNNQTVNLETQKSEGIIQKPKKADNDIDNDIDNENDKDPLPIEGVIGGDNSPTETFKISGRKAGQAFASFLKRVKDKIPDEHIENCFISLSENLKSGDAILKCADDWLLTVFNKNGKTNFPAKSLVDFSRVNLQKYKDPPKQTPGIAQTQEYLARNRELAKNSVNPFALAKDDALEWLKTLPDFWRAKSKAAREIINKYGFNENDFKKPDASDGKE